MSRSIYILMLLAIFSCGLDIIADQSKIENQQILIIQGLSLQNISRTDIEQKFGKIGSEHFSETRGTEQICFMDADGSDTALEFELGEVGASYRLFHATAGQKKGCHKSSIVKPTLTTGGGLKLGLSRTEVNAILHKPTHSNKNLAIWEESTSRALTPEEISRFKGANPSESIPSVLDISTKITVRFVNSRAFSIEVAHSEST